MTAEERHELVDKWKLMQAYREPVSALYWNHERGIKHTGSSKYAIDRVRNVIQTIRAEMRHTEPMDRKRKELEGNIRQFAKKHLLGKNSRTSVGIKIGGGIEASKTKIGYSSSPHIDIRIGWFWLRNVYDRIYKDRFVLGSDMWFIMSADEVSINEKNIRMFRGMIYRRSTDELVEGFIGQAKVGKETSVIKQSLRQAIQSTKNIVAEEFRQKLTGENND